MKLIVALGLLLTLPGCAGFGAEMYADAMELRGEAREYIRENHEVRRWVRAECLASIRREIEAYKKDSVVAEMQIRRLLKEIYPDLVTIDLARRAQTEGIQRSQPFGCEVELDGAKPG